MKSNSRAYGSYFLNSDPHLTLLPYPCTSPPPSPLHSFAAAQYSTCSIMQIFFSQWRRRRRRRRGYANIMRRFHNAAADVGARALVFYFHEVLRPRLILLTKEIKGKRERRCERTFSLSLCLSPSLLPNEKLLFRASKHSRNLLWRINESRHARTFVDAYYIYAHVIPSPRQFRSPLFFLRRTPPLSLSLSLSLSAFSIEQFQWKRRARQYSNPGAMRAPPSSAREKIPAPLDVIEIGIWVWTRGKAGRDGIFCLLHVISLWRRSI